MRQVTVGRLGSGGLGGFSRPCLILAAAAFAMLCLRHEFGSASSTAMRQALAAAWIVVPLVGLHSVQAALSTEGWRTIMAAGGERRRFGEVLRLRVLREGLDTLLPIAAIAGEIVAAAELRRGGVRGADVTATLAVDIATEIGGQIVYLAVALLAALAFTGTGWLGGAVGLLSVGSLVAGTAILFRLRPLHLTSALVRRFAPHAGAHLASEIGAIEQVALRLVADRRALATATAWHASHWLLGAVETSLCFAALGIVTSPVQALAVNGLGLAARSIGVVVPGSAGVQEGGFAAAGALLGLPAEAALAVSLLRRGRELGFGLLALPLLRLGRPASALVPLAATAV